MDLNYYKEMLVVPLRLTIPNIEELLTSIILVVLILLLISYVQLIFLTWGGSRAQVASYLE